MGGSANPAVVPLIRDRVRVGCQAAGRRSDQVRVVLGAVTVVDRDGAAARRRARTEVAKYLAVVADLDATTELPAGFADQVRDLVAAGRDEAAGALIPDEVLDRFAFSGTPEHVAALAQRVLDAGAGRVDFGAPHGLDRRRRRRPARDRGPAAAPALTPDQATAEHTLGLYRRGPRGKNFPIRKRCRKGHVPARHVSA